MRKGIFFYVLCLFFCGGVYAQEEKEALVVTVITDSECSFCTTEPTELLLKEQFGQQVMFEHIDYRAKKGTELITKYSLKTLPAFLILDQPMSEEITDEAALFFRKKEHAFIVVKEIAGTFRFLQRVSKKDTIDLFFSFTDAGILPMLTTVKSFCEGNGLSLSVHFLHRQGISQKEIMRETEEMQRLYAVRELYPQQFFSYLFRRLQDIDSSWWPDAMTALDIDFKKIKKFTESEAMNKIMVDEMNQINALGIKRGVALLVHNVSLFMMTDITDEVLTKITR